MIAIKKGNDIPIYFTIYRNGEPISLAQAQNIQIAVHHETLCNSDLTLSKINVNTNPLYFEVNTNNAPEGNYYALVTFEMPNPYTGQMSYFSVDAQAFRLIDHSRNQGDIPVCDVCEEVTMPLLIGGTIIIAKGDPGDSAYEIAVKNGFEGTEEEWLASLKGDTGPVGPQGPIGPQGEIGPVGPTGKDGIDGKSAYQIAVEGGFEGTEEEYNNLLTTVPTYGERITLLETVPNALYLSYPDVSYDQTSNTYTVNGITGITPTEMANIYQFTAFQIYNYNLIDQFYGANIKTNLKPRRLAAFGASSGATTDANHTRAFVQCSAVKIYLTNDNRYVRAGKNWYGTFELTSNLTEIIGIILLHASTTVSDVSNMFRSSNVSSFLLKNLAVNFNLATAPNVTRDTMLYIINNATNTSAITITVHADTLARLTEEDIALASSKNITLTA